VGVAATELTGAANLADRAAAQASRGAFKAAHSPARAAEVPGRVCQSGHIPAGANILSELPITAAATVDGPSI